MSLTLTTEERNLPISLCVSLNPLEARKRERETEKERERERERERDRQTDRQTEIDRQRDGQRERQTDREVSTALRHQLPLSIICLLRLEVKAV